MDAQAKQLVVERVRQVSNILVTVSSDPSVDQLAACIGLTLLLNKIGKHATAVFSGKVPSTIEFLQPEKTIQTNTDSLRDFIISLDKSKADKLRYKIEDQFVRIYITPYRSSLTEKDLQFAQGEFNVEAVIALGVRDQNQLDAAITAHGKILHDATVISVTAGSGQPSKLGQINWQDPGASSLSEMIVSISEAFGSNLLDAQMATAFLTGIVAVTDRFSNPKTSPKVMTMSAQLMAAGANQQLIASKLQPEVAATSPLPAAPKINEPASLSAAPQAPAKPADGALNVKHDGSSDSGEVDITSSEIRIDPEGNLKNAGQKAIENQAPSLPGSHALLNMPPAAQSGLSANSQETDQAEASPDPLLSSTGPQEDGLLTHAPDVTPPSEEQARSAVESAYAASSDNPAAEALAEVPDIVPPPAAPPTPPLPPVSATPPPPKKDEGPQAPPFPPPLTTSNGVVIPPPFSPPNNQDNNTL